jgi:hypothetical protein
MKTHVTFTADLVPWVDVVAENAEAKKNKVQLRIACILKWHLIRTPRILSNAEMSGPHLVFDPSIAVDRQI